MPSKTVKAVKVEDFKQYCGSRAVKEVALFLAELSQAQTEKDIKFVCENKLGQLRERFDKLNTLNSYVGYYRNGIRKWQADTKLNKSNSFPNKSAQKKGDTVKGRSHLALAFLALPKEDQAARAADQEVKKTAQRRNLQPFSHQAMMEAAMKALESTSYLEVSAAIEYLIGRRPTEVLKGTGFKITGLHTIEFSGALKKKDTATFEIYTLCEAAKVVDALAKVQQDFEVKELANDSNANIDSRRNSSLNTAVRRVFSEILPPPTGNKLISNKSLRAAYVWSAAILFLPDNESESSFAQRLLGHERADTMAAYEDYYPVDAKGKRIRERGIWLDKLEKEATTPESQRKTSIGIDGLRLERFHKIPGKTNADRLDAALTAWEQQSALENKIAELERQLGVVTSLTEAQAKAIAKKEEADKAKWADIPSEELKGSQAPGSANEKIRRAVEAIKAFNQGKTQREKYALSEANVRYLTGTRHAAVKDYFKTHPELARYNDEYGFGLQHDRGKTDISKVINW